MLCAHTIRRLKPGTYDQFAQMFGPPEDADPGRGSVSTFSGAWPTRTR